MSAGSSVRIVFTEVSLLPQLLQKPVSVLSVLPFLQKEGTQMGKPCTRTQMKQLLPGLDDAGEEDIWLTRCSFRSKRESKSLTCFETVYSRVTMILVQRWVFKNRPKDMSVDIEKR